MQHQDGAFVTSDLDEQGDRIADVLAPPGGLAFAGAGGTFRWLRGSGAASTSPGWNALGYSNVAPSSSDDAFLLFEGRNPHTLVRATEDGDSETLGTFDTEELFDESGTVTSSDWWISPDHPGSIFGSLALRPSAVGSEPVGMCVRIDEEDPEPEILVEGASCTFEDGGGRALASDEAAVTLTIADPDGTTQSVDVPGAGITDYRFDDSGRFVVARSVVMTGPTNTLLTVFDSETATMVWTSEGDADEWRFLAGSESGSFLLSSSASSTILMGADGSETSLEISGTSTDTAPDGAGWSSAGWISSDGETIVLAESTALVGRISAQNVDHLRVATFDDAGEQVHDLADVETEHVLENLYVTGGDTPTVVVGAGIAGTTQIHAGPIDGELTAASEELFPRIDRAYADPATGDVVLFGSDESVPSEAVAMYLPGGKGEDAQFVELDQSARALPQLVDMGDGSVVMASNHGTEWSVFRLDDSGRTELGTVDRDITMRFTVNPTGAIVASSDETTWWCDGECGEFEVVMEAARVLASKRPVRALDIFP